MDAPVPLAAGLLIPVTSGLSQLNVVPAVALDAMYVAVTSSQRFCVSTLVRTGFG